jgi:indolepyruvate ferredoxin oxidoreductase
MVAFMEPERVGDIVGLTQMGGEGAQWIGISPFIERSHLIQNIGDGTFFHSGSLAVRAAVAANVDITYKLLYNGTVAMTGGQDPQGQMSVPDVAHLLRIEGVKRIIVTSDDPGRHERSDFPAGVDLWDRGRLTEAQQELAKVKGVTVLIHDQACAAEQRRGRSRGTVATPNFRVVINERVCEGCGDCGDVSNCLSVQPVDTPFGRKTRIHQGSCNFDFSCMKGDCPSFATVELVESTNEPRALPSPPTDIADPAAPIVNADAFTVRLTGIGGTGVITVSQIVGTAAMLADRTVRGLDQTGLSQKAGPVVSDVIITTDAAPASNHGNASGIDTILGFDFLVAAQPANLNGARVDRTVMVASTDAVPTGSMVTEPGLRLPSGNDLVERVGSVTRSGDNRFLDAAALAEGLLGSTTTANLLVLGAAVQCGALPLPVEAVERAIELNGVAIAKNLDAFRWGRAWIDNRQQVERAADLQMHVAPETTAQLFERLAGDLVDYQSEKYSARFRSVIATAQLAEQQLDQDDQFTRAVVIHLHKLMAYKDEYEVARLLLDDEANASYAAVGGTGTKVTYHLHPPMLRSLGLDRKLELRRSAPPALAALRAGKRVRGTLADPFRWAAVRKLERAMIPEYIKAVEQLCHRLSAGNIDEAVAIASLPDQVRGFESLKVTRATAYRAELADQMRSWSNAR